ncbi:uroporphyrinogen-III C-methyltransferase [Viridibacterium curvum]|uniref:Uroporphyrin-3 C-methyltransferase n=1 Tax=Viridibacterium curvum TaxID=1101404 RepID=A0ABP9QJ54_9RHOO
MSEQQTEQATTPEAPPVARADTSPAGNARSTSGNPVTGSTLLTPRAQMTIAVVVLVFLGWQLLDTRNELRSLREDIARRAGAESAELSNARQLARNGQESAAALQGRVSTLEDRVGDSETQQAALERIYQDLSRNRDDRLLQEAEQAVSLASQQLQLAGNVPVALSALQLADARLASSAQTRLLPLRRAIAQDIERLRALPLVDVTGMSLELEALLARIDTLPFAFERMPPAKPAAAPVAAPRKPAAPAPRKGAATPAAAPSAPQAEDTSAPGWVTLAGDLWGDFKGLLRIERLDSDDVNLLSPQQASYLRENIRLRLLSARLALLQRDGRMFAEDLNQARGMLEKYFDIKAPAVAGTAEELRQMASARLIVDLPALSESEAALRRLRQVR